MNDEKFLSGQEAAEFLGVKSATLYAYASRGLIESIPGKTARERLYRLSDLIRLRQSARGFKSTKDQNAPVWTGPVIKSAITEILEDGHCYRGESAIALAHTGEPFERVVEWIWDTGSDVNTWTGVKPLTVPKSVRALCLRETDYLDIQKLLLVAFEMSDPVARRLTREDRFETARSLIVTMSLAPALPDAMDSYRFEEQYPIAQSLLNSISSDRSKIRAEAMNSALVLCADHELNASALAARIAASCDASIYSCLLSALGSFSGTLHGSASRRAEDIVSNSFKFGTARAWLKDYLNQYEKIPGFGTELYAKGDPRARVLIDIARRVSKKDKHVNRLVEIVECVRQYFGQEPNLDFGLAAISYALALPPGSGSTIFSISRMAGWIAHAIEQRQYGGLIRPRARYIGKSS